VTATGLPHQSSDPLVVVELLRETGSFVLEVGSDLLLCEILLALMPLDVLVDLCDTAVGFSSPLRYYTVHGCVWTWISQQLSLHPGAVGKAKVNQQDLYGQSR